MSIRRVSQTVMAGAIAAALSFPAAAATVGTSFDVAFSDFALLTVGNGVGEDFVVSDHVTATITQTDTDAAQLDFHFLSDGFGFAALYLDTDTDFDGHSGGTLAQDVANARSVFQDRFIPRGLAFTGPGNFDAGQQLSVDLSAPGLDIEDWNTFLFAGSSTGLFGGLVYTPGDGNLSIFAIEGNVIPASGSTAFVPDIAQVPLPAGGALLVVGLGSLAFVRRRKT